MAEHAELLAVERTNRRIMMTKGEVHMERRERAEALQVGLYHCFERMGC